MAVQSKANGRFMSLHIGIAGPIDTAQLSDLLESTDEEIPVGSASAPFMAVLIREFLSMGLRVSAFTTDASIFGKATTQGIPYKHFSGPGLDLYICPARPRAWRFNGRQLGRAVDAFGYERACLKAAMQAAAPDILHAHWTYEFALAALATNLPSLVTAHDSPGVVLKFNKNAYRLIRYLMALQVYKQAKKLTTVSPYMVNEIRRYTKSQVSVVPNPLAAYVLAAGQAKTVPPVNRRIVMVCNGWDDRKNPKPALQAFGRFVAIEKDAELHLYGHGYGHGEQAQTWCETQAIAKNMHFHGKVDHTTLIKHMQDYDVLLHPALEESFGVVIAEAMALGLPVVAGQASGAVPWVLGAGQDDTLPGVLVDVQDVAAITQGLQTVFDADYLARSRTGVTRAQAIFSPAAIAEQYLMEYATILHASR